MIIYTDESVLKKLLSAVAGCEGATVRNLQAKPLKVTT